MRANLRLKKLEQFQGGGIFVGLLEDREGCERTESGVTHAPVEGVTFARSEYSTDGAFWAAVEARSAALGVMPGWVRPEHNNI